MIDPKTLTGIPFFADLNDRELEEVAKILKKKTYKPGDVIFTETRDGESLYILRKGEVKACKTAPDGQLFTLTVMKDGDIFGEMSFLDGRHRCCYNRY